jgi:hypothetical protein
MGFNSLSRLSLWKLVDALEPVVFNPYQTEGIFELLRFVGEPGAADEDLITLMIHYASSRLKYLVRCPRFAALMRKQPDLTYRILSYVCDSL